MKLFLIIDMLNGFCRSGYPLSLTETADKIEKYIKKQIESYHKNNDQIIFICDSHSINAIEFKQYPPHCIKGTEEADIVDSLAEYSNKENVLYKNTLSVFYKTRLETFLKIIKPDEVHIVGVLTNICILFAAYEFRTRGFKTFVHKNGTMASTKNLHQFFIDYIKQFLGAEVI